MSIPSLALFSFLAASAMMFAGSPAAANVLDENRSAIKDLPRLTVRGTAELEKPADQLRMQLGVVTEHADANEALRRNTRQMRDVQAAVERVGLGEGEYETGRFQIRPVYSRRPPRQVDQDWRPEIVAYSVTNTINIKTRQLNLAGQLIQAATEAGANTVNLITFDLAEPRIHRAEAIASATANARSDAQALAEAAGLRLVRVLEIGLDDPQPIHPVQYERAAMAMDAEPAPPITPGDVTVRANVNIVYEIAPAD